MNSDTTKALVLSVDDEPGILRSRHLLLECVGYRVLSASSGEHALTQFEANPVDLVLLDYFMPGMDGSVVALEMKRQRPDIPIILVSASPMAYAARGCVDCILPKGEGPQVLFERMEHMLRRRRPLG